MAENTINLGHYMLLSKTSILAMKSRHRDHLIREAIWTELHPNNMNKENKFSLSSSWKPLIHFIKGRSAPSPRAEENLKL
jgi:hypothetical protein